MTQTLGRIGAMFLRYLYLHKRSLPRTFEIILWPVMELLVWGYVSMYLRSLSQNSLLNVTSSLINAMIFWDILYRSQQGVSISFVEDIWTQNILNLLISPLKIWEWIAAAILYGIVKILIIVTILSLIVASLFHLNWISNLSFFLLPSFIRLGAWDLHGRADDPLGTRGGGAHLGHSFPDPAAGCRVLSALRAAALAATGLKSPV